MRGFDFKKMDSDRPLIRKAYRDDFLRRNLEKIDKGACYNALVKHYALYGTFPSTGHYIHLESKCSTYVFEEDIGAIDTEEFNNEKESIGVKVLDGFLSRGKYLTLTPEYFNTKRV